MRRYKCVTQVLNWVKMPQISIELREKELLIKISYGKSNEVMKRVVESFFTTFNELCKLKGVNVSVSVKDNTISVRYSDLSELTKLIELMTKVSTDIEIVSKALPLVVLKSIEEESEEEKKVNYIN